MKKKLAVAIGICYLLQPVFPAYAEINGNEAELLAIINGKQEYQGVLYEVAPQYREAAKAYLDDPNIDCTDEQKQKAINKMFGNIQQGIDMGYLIPATGTAFGDNSESGSTVTESNMTEEVLAEDESDATEEMESEIGGSVLEETEPSPLVLALEAAMNAPEESTEPEDIVGSLLPEMSFPVQAARYALAAAIIGMVFGIGTSAFWGLFRHHHRKRTKHS